MGWNDSRIDLLPPNWIQRVEEVPGTRTMEGRPIQLVHAIPQAGAAGQRIDAKMVRDQLQTKEFSLLDYDADRGFLSRQDIEAFLQIENGELAQLVLTFRMAADSPSHWRIWKELVDDLCATWGLRLVDPQHGNIVGSTDLFRILSSTIAWREFARNFNWPKADSETE
jgi:hypothetical protein